MKSNEGSKVKWKGKSILQVPDTGTRVLDNTRPFLRSSIVSFWITPARSKERKYHIFRQYWYTRNVPVFTNTGTFQYLGPEVYFFPVITASRVPLRVLWGYSAATACAVAPVTVASEYPQRYSNLQYTQRHYILWGLYVAGRRNLNV